MTCQNEIVENQLLKAVTTHDVGTLQRLLKDGVDPNMIVPVKPATYYHRKTLSLLMLAARERDFDCLKVLLEHGANVQQKVEDGTALGEAVKTGKADNVRLLLDHGADVNDQGDGGTEYLQIVEDAVEGGYVPGYEAEVHDVLYQYGARLLSSFEQYTDEQFQNILKSADEGYLPRCNLCNSLLNIKRDRQGKRWHFYCLSRCTDVYWPQNPVLLEK